MRQVLAITLAATLAAAGAAAGEEKRGRVGRAFHVGTGDLIYTEHHLEDWRAGRIVGDTVTYRDPSGQVFAQKQVDYTPAEQAPGFELRNRRTGHLEGATVAADRLEIRFRPVADAPLDVQTIAKPEGAIMDAGFDRFVESNWDALLAGGVFVRPFLVPSRLDFIDFRIRRIDGGEVPGEVTFEMVPDSVLLRLLAPPIRVAYEARTRSLLEYRGVSNLRDEAGENIKVRIRFDGPPTVHTASGE